MHAQLHRDHAIHVSCLLAAIHIQGTSFCVHTVAVFIRPEVKYILTIVLEHVESTATTLHHRQVQVQVLP